MTILGSRTAPCAPGTPAGRIHLLKGAADVLIPAGHLIGNTAEKILHQVDCSVLTVKPDGFVSPVT